MTTPACAVHDHGATAAMFTATDRESHVAARAICDTCPLVATCTPAMWGAEEPTGTWGRVLYGLPGRNRRAAA